MKIEMLSERMWIENGEDFSKCENIWLEVDYENTLDLIDVGYNISKVTETKTREYLKRDSALNLLKEGKVLRLPVVFIREINNKPKCPKCGSSYKKECICYIQDKFKDMNYYVKIEDDCSELQDLIENEVLKEIKR